MYIIYSVAYGSGLTFDYDDPWLYDEAIVLRPSESVMMVPGTVSIDD